MWQEQLGVGIDEVRIPAAALIFRAGQEPKIALLGSGIVRVYIATPLGRQLTIRYARAGDLIGLAPYLAGTDQWANTALGQIAMGGNPRNRNKDKEFGQKAFNPLTFGS